MIYTTLTKKALKISFEAHRDQTDKSGLPYIFHPFHLAEQMDDEYSVCVALLHDVIEDSSFTIQDLISNGFPKEVIEAIKTLTHSKDVPYLEYIKLIKDNILAAKVKIEDLKHNSDISRMDHLSETDYERLEKYKQALDILLS
jgi:(p)ppGpp synthase/HD superfamily hydrolase